MANKKENMEYTGTYFIDIDGTIIDGETEEILPGAKELLDALISDNRQIIITTARGDYMWPHKYSKRATTELLERLGIKYDQILFNISSPRVVLNDRGAESYNHPKNKEYSKELILTIKNIVELGR